MENESDNQAEILGLDIIQGYFNAQMLRIERVRLLNELRNDFRKILIADEHTKALVDAIMETKIKHYSKL